jgi:hypothetical protein
MTKALVVCPATKSEEQIDYLATPLGPLIHACSRFAPSTALACQRACAAGPRCELGRNDQPIAAGPNEDTDIDIEITLPFTRR